LAKSDKKEIFSASGGQPTPLTPDAIQTLFKRLTRETGIHVNPHKFRHTFATRALSAGVDVMALPKALGHTTLAMVSRYVHYQKDDLLDAWRQRRD
jgi:integrase/recombinase XerD